MRLAQFGLALAFTTACTTTRWVAPSQLPKIAEAHRFNEKRSLVDREGKDVTYDPDDELILKMNDGVQTEPVPFANLAQVLAYRRDPAATQFILPIADIDSVGVRTGAPGTLVGAGFGALGGMAVGALTGLFMSAASCPSDSIINSCGPGGHAKVAGVMGGIGALVGLIAGILAGAGD